MITNVLDPISRRRGSLAILVNSAYTSPMDNHDGILLGEGREDSFYDFNRLCSADKNVTRNVLLKYYDKEIDQ
jgi:hypothetical protein